MAEIFSFAKTLSLLRESLHAVTRRYYDDLVTRLNDADVLKKTLNVGDRFPDFALPNGRGQFIQSAELLARGPLIVTFYRGRWCPFCRAAIEAMMDTAPALEAMGATVVGVTAEVGAGSLCVESNHPLNFQMLCDLDNGLALECGLLFRLTDDLVAWYGKRGLDLEQTYGNGSCFLPIPASYVVDGDGVIRFAFLNADFRYRADPQDLLHALKQVIEHDAPSGSPNRASAPV